MQISFGPPGYAGVTSLIAVGADELDEGVTDRTVRIGGWLAAAVWAIGAMSGNRTIANAGMGGTIALVAIRCMTRRGMTIPVTVEPADRLSTRR